MHKCLPQVHALWSPLFWIYSQQILNVFVSILNFYLCRYCGVMKVREIGSFAMENWNSHTKTDMHQDNRISWMELHCEIRWKHNKGTAGFMDGTWFKENHTISCIFWFWEVSKAKISQCYSLRSFQCQYSSFVHLYYITSYALLWNNFWLQVSKSTEPSKMCHLIW